MEGPGERPGVRHSSKGRGHRWSQGLSDDEDGEGDADEAELAAELEGSECATAQRGRQGLPGSGSPLASPPSAGFQRRWQGKKRRGQPARQVSDDSDLDVEAQAALEQLASPYSRHTPRWAGLRPSHSGCACAGVWPRAQALLCLQQSCTWRGLTAADTLPEAVLVPGRAPITCGSRDEELEEGEEDDGAEPPVRSLADKLGLTPSRKSRTTLLWPTLATLVLVQPGRVGARNISYRQLVTLTTSLEHLIWNNYDGAGHAIV